MWEDFMRGNWPVAVPSVPAASDESPARRTVTDAPATHTREPAAATMVTAFAEVRPRKPHRPRKAHRRGMTARLASAFGAS